ncbi:MAG TPA: hypothetical protein VM370_02905 [Candidatus Thermoplasmatota archaeon]|nr:hypothetical protein [Candidatus Thermoplasmatota archaeon]
MSAPFAPSADGEERPQREVAQRVFASEFNDAKHSYKESGDRSPKYVVSPFGAKINRMFAVGVLTSVEPGGNQAGSYKAQVVDPTGTFYVWAGQYEPEAASQLADIRPPAIVALVGKGNAREADQGVTYVNVRPESIRVVERNERDAWVLETARHSMMRLDALREAQKLEAPTAAKLEELGFPKDVSEGVMKAIEHYGKADLAKYAQVIRDALETLLPGGAEKIAAEPSFAPAAATYQAPAAAAARAASPAATTPPKGSAENPHKDVVLGFIERRDEGKGAPWEDIVSEAGKKGIKEADVEECLNALMDDGLIYEPVLGRLKKTT